MAEMTADKVKDCPAQRERAVELLQQAALEMNLDQDTYARRVRQREKIPVDVMLCYAQEIEEQQERHRRERENEIRESLQLLFVAILLYAIAFVIIDKCPPVNMLWNLYPQFHNGLIIFAGLFYLIAYEVRRRL